MSNVTFKVGRIKLNLPGFRKLRTGPRAVARVERAARGIANAAGPGFAVDAPEKPSPNRARRTVHPTTPEAQHKDLKDLTLIRSLDGGRS